MLSSESFQATSGSTIQNSVRWRRVFDFSARNVGPKQYTLPERGGGRLDVQLAGLRQVRLAQVEVLGRRRAFPACSPIAAGQDRRVHQHEAALVEEVADRLDHLVPHPGDRHLAAAAQPEVPVLEQERGAVLLGRDREVAAGPEDLRDR